MDFRLVYRGPLKSSGNDVPKDFQAKKEHKHDIRLKLHPQIKQLWNYPPFNSNYGQPNATPYHVQYLNPQHERGQHRVGNYKFVRLVRRDLKLTAELDILLLRREYPGPVLIQGGDLDNRLKTLLDALRVPKELQEIPENFNQKGDEDPLFCLLEDDDLITSIKLTSDTLLILPCRHQMSMF